MPWYDPTTWDNEWNEHVTPHLEQASDWVGDLWDEASGQDAADKQAAAIGAAAKEDQAYEFPNVSGPLGSQTVTRNADGTVTLNQALSPQQQALVSGLYGDAGTSRQRVEDALYQRQTARLDPQWEDTEEQRRTRLYNMGLTEGDRAYDTEMRNLGFQRNDAYDAARNASILAGGNEQTRLINAIMQASNPGLDRYWGQGNNAQSAIAQGNIQAGVPTGLETILSLLRG